jgi:hypothetical protein
MAQEQMLNSAKPSEMKEDELLGRAESLGIFLSKDTFGNWRRRGLAPKPIRQKHGGRGVGKVFYYSESALPHLRTLYILIQETPKSFTRVGFHLWALGYIDDEKWWKKRLKGVPLRIAKYLSAIEASDCPGELNEKGLRAIHRAAASRNKGEMMGPIRRRVGKDGFESLLAIFVKAALGNFDPKDWQGLPDQDQEELQFLFDRLLDLAGGKNKKKLPSASSISISTGDFQDAIIKISSIFRGNRNILEGCTKSQILVARNELAFLFCMVRELARQEMEDGSLTAPIRALASMSRDLEKFLDVYVICICVWARLRIDPEIYAGLQHINSAIKSSISSGNIQPNQSLLM